MSRFAPLMVSALLLVVALVTLSGCGGDAGFIVGEGVTDDIAGHWVASQQSATLTGTRSAVTVADSISFVVTAAGLKTWSGSVSSSAGSKLSPAFGLWTRSGDVYSLSNSAGQSSTFGWYEHELYSLTLSNGTIVYQWWTKQ
jgi:hypothetical protein